MRIKIRLKILLILAVTAIFALAMGTTAMAGTAAPEGLSQTIPAGTGAPQAAPYAAGDTFIDGGGIKYKVLTESGTTGTVEVIANNYNNASYTIPSTATNGTITYDVTSIGDNAFYYCTSLASVSIGSSVTSIGGSAFSFCTSLTAINTNPNNPNYTSVDGVLFDKQKTVLIHYPAGKAGTSYTIPASVTSIGEYAFYNCYSLASINIPDSVISIGDNAFRYCTSLTSVNIPASVETIGDNAFAFCTSLASINIPASVISIGRYAFASCTLLTAINTDPNNPNYTSVEGVLFDKQKTVLIQYPINKGGTSYTIPASVTSIDGFAFADCISLDSVIIPASVTSIEEFAFYNCTSLTSVNVPASVETIGNYAFSYCTSLTSVNIPSSVTSIDGFAFADCISLDSVIIPASVTSIEEFAFYNCTSLTSVSIPASVETIGNNAFLICTSLTSVSIPASVETIGNYAFAYCTSLNNMFFSAEVPPSFGANIFFDNSSMTINVPTGKTLAYTTALSGMLPPGSTFVEFTPIKIATISLPNGQMGTAYSQTIQTNIAGTGFSLALGKLPDGLSLNATTGEISGTPSSAGTFSFSVEARNVNSADLKSYTIDIPPVIPPVVPPVETTYAMAQIPSAANNYTAKVDVVYTDFIGLTIGGKALTSADFTSWSGSTFVRLNPTYLATLPAGNHTIVLAFAGGTATANFTKSATGTGTSTGTDSSSGSSGMASTYKSGTGTPGSTTDANYNPSTGGASVMSVTVVFMIISLAGAIIQLKRRCQR